ncbi:MAG TPA: hypothetical protein VNC40_08665 [Gaiellaceae bacterium]|nr:hypothetical protein [Gaiellaceae bacterium]
MPAEVERLQRRVGTRDRWFLGLGLCAALVGAPVGVLLARPGASSTADTCITTVRASMMGGATFRYCGPDAAAFCQASGAEDKSVAAKCRELGLPTTR